MVASGLSTMGMVVAMTLFLLPLRAWYTTTSEWLVDSQARLVREKMLHQIRTGQSGVGLRSASRTVDKPGNSSTSEWVDFSVDQHAGTSGDPITPDNAKDDASWRIQWNKGLGLVSKDTGQPQDILPASITVTNVTFDKSVNGLVLTSTVTIQSQVKKWTYSRAIVSNVYLINP